MKSNIYFPSLNGVRAIAAIMVIFHHIEQVKNSNTLPNLAALPIFHKTGALGVTLFFVLSGFLITYLLYVEQNSTKTINLLKFYMRRLLRIWPLYFFIIAVSLTYSFYFGTNPLSSNFFKEKLFLYSFFLPNIAYILYASGGFPSQLWSVGTEEQFYLIWPHLIKNKLIASIKGLIIIIFIVNICKIFFYTQSLDNEFSFHGIKVHNFAYQFLDKFRVDCMAVGAIGANLYFNKASYVQALKFIYSNTFQVASYLTLFVLLLAPTNFGLFENQIFSVLFLFIILNLATNPNTFMTLENKPLKFLGAISYGLYIYHPLILISIMQLSLFLNIQSSSSFPILYGITVFISTIVISYLSYKYIESPFLRLKHKFTIIPSGDQSKNDNLESQTRNS
jgi:peptidoglycan/LPS O-acetylase OafA/YrhL